MRSPEPGLAQIQDAISELLREEEIATLATVDADGRITGKRPYDAVVGRRA
jgi:hypothetical protein